MRTPSPDSAKYVLEASATRLFAHLNISSQGMLTREIGDLLQGFVPASDIITAGRDLIPGGSAAMVKIIDKPNEATIPKETNRTHPAPARGLIEPVESEADAVRVVRALIESSRAREARERTAEFLKTWPDSRRLNTAARILAPAVAKAVPPRKPQRSHALENKWIVENARNYPGEWLLIFEDRLIASGPDLNEVIALGQQSEEGRDGVLWFQPTPEWIYGRSI